MSEPVTPNMQTVFQRMVFASHTVNPDILTRAYENDTTSVTTSYPKPGKKFKRRFSVETLVSGILGVLPDFKYILNHTFRDTRGHVLVSPRGTIQVIPSNVEDEAGDIHLTAQVFVHLSDQAALAPLDAYFTAAMTKVRAKRTPPEDPPTSLYILTHDRTGYGLHEIGEESKGTTGFIPANYEPDIVSDFEFVSKEIIAKDPCGRLLLVDGPPGTGKTRMVRSLVGAMMGGGLVVMVPPHLAANLSGPELLPVLLRSHSGQPIVLVLEDADFAIVSRESGSVSEASISALSSILNLSDGIIGQHIDIRIVATTNAQLKEIDAAVLRDGRLIRRMSVGLLSPERAQAVIAREARVDTTHPDTVCEGPTKLSACYARARKIVKGK